MHARASATLDVKPSNVILRYQTKIVPADARPAGPLPVLVDFGLAGSQGAPRLRSPYYGRARDLGHRELPAIRVDPLATDVYAFSCLAYEMLTGITLFGGDSLPAIITAHLTHEEGPESSRWLRKHRQAAALADLLSMGLRRQPPKAHQAVGYAHRARRNRPKVVCAI